MDNPIRWFLTSLTPGGGGLGRGVRTFPFKNRRSNHTDWNWPYFQLKEPDHRLPLQPEGLNAQLDGLFREGVQITPAIAAVHDFR